MYKYTWLCIYNACSHTLALTLSTPRFYETLQIQFFGLENFESLYYRRTPMIILKSYHAFCRLFNIGTQLYPDLRWLVGQNDLAANAQKTLKELIKSLSKP